MVGLDEAGRGPLAGPVVAACCFIPEGLFIEGINDSKALSSEQRASIFEVIKSHPEIIYAVGQASHEEIDTINIFQASKLAMRRAVEALALKPDFLLIDGFRIPELDFPQQHIIRGDSLSYCVAAASIIAKETRDALMRLYEEEFPGYGFAQHKGYATKKHKESLAALGRCPIHRRSFLIDS